MIVSPEHHHLYADECDASLAAIRAGRQALLDSCRLEVRRHPQDATAVLRLGHALMALGRFAAAAKAFQRSVRLAPCAEADYYHGRSLAELGRWKRAAAAFRSAIRQDRNFAEAYLHLATALAQLGRHVQSLVALERALQLKRAAAMHCVACVINKAVACTGEQPEDPRIGWAVETWPN